MLENLNINKKYLYCGLILKDYPIITMEAYCNIQFLQASFLYSYFKKLSLKVRILVFYTFNLFNLC